MSRHQVLYHPRVVRGRRHLFAGTGAGLSSKCGDALFTAALVDDPRLPLHAECRLVATTEITLALDSLGLHGAAIEIARAVNDLSYETAAAQGGA